MGTTAQSVRQVDCMPAPRCHCRPTARASLGRGCNSGHDIGRERSPTGQRTRSAHCVRPGEGRARDNFFRITHDAGVRTTSGHDTRWEPPSCHPGRPLALTICWPAGPSGFGIPNARGAFPVETAGARNCQSNPRHRRKPRPHRHPRNRHQAVRSRIRFRGPAFPLKRQGNPIPRRQTHPLGQSSPDQSRTRSSHATL